MKHRVAFLVAAGVIVSTASSLLLSGDLSTSFKGGALASSRDGWEQQTGLKTLMVFRPVFTANQGQFTEVVLFRGDVGGATVWFTSDAVYYQFIRELPGSAPEDDLTGFGYRLPERPDSIDY